MSLRPFFAFSFATLALSTLALTTVARADQFEPNHMFVSCANSKLIVEFDENGQFVRNIAPPGINSPQSLAFGPNGLLYATSLSTNELYEILPNGQTSQKIFLGNNVGPNAVRVGPEGLLYVNGQTDRVIHRVDVLTGTPFQIGGIPLQTLALNDFEFTSNGTLVGVHTDNHLLYEFNLGGQILRTKSVSATAFPMGIAIGPFDMVWFSALGLNSVSRATSFLAVLDNFPLADLGSPTGMVCGPNGNLFICSHANDRVLEFNPNTFQVEGAVGFNVPSLDGPYGIAFAPFRFEGEIEGRVGGDEEGTEGFDEDVFISIAPGSRTIMVQFEDNVNEDGIAAFFFENAFVFHGSETGDPSSKRLFNGVEIHQNAGQGTGRIDLEVKTSKDGNLDFLKVKKASGRIGRSGAGGSIFGEIKTQKLLD